MKISHLCIIPPYLLFSLLLLLLLLSLQGAQLLTAAKGLSNLKVTHTDLCLKGTFEARTGGQSLDAITTFLCHKSSLMGQISSKLPPKHT